MESKKSKDIKRSLFALITFSAITFLCFYKNYNYKNYNENINFFNIDSDDNNFSSSTYKDTFKVCIVIMFYLFFSWRLINNLILQLLHIGLNLIKSTTFFCTL